MDADADEDAFADSDADADGDANDDLHATAMNNLPAEANAHAY